MNASSTIPTLMLRALRQRVASVIAEAKSYEVPALCRRLGLEDGSTEEAHRSKFKYAQQRLAGVDGPRLLAMARELLKESDDYVLAEGVAKMDELSSEPITP